MTSDSPDSSSPSPKYNDVVFNKEEWILFLARTCRYTKLLQYLLENDTSICLPKIQVIVPANNQFSIRDVDYNLNDLYFAICHKHCATITKLDMHFKKEVFNLGSMQDKTIHLLKDFN